jgi:hypothetical protein
MLGGVLIDIGGEGVGPILGFLLMGSSSESRIKGRSIVPRPMDSGDGFWVFVSAGVTWGKTNVGSDVGVSLAGGFVSGSS